MALAADRYSALSPQLEGSAVDLGGIASDLSALRDELGVLEERLGSAPAYRDFSFPPDQLRAAARCRQACERHRRAARAQRRARPATAVPAPPGLTTPWVPASPAADDGAERGAMRDGPRHAASRAVDIVPAAGLLRSAHGAE